MASSSDYTNLRRLKYRYENGCKEQDICKNESYCDNNQINTNAFSNISVTNDVLIGGNIYFHNNQPNEYNNINGNLMCRLFYANKQKMCK
jgi:hypothetical protein